MIEQERLSTELANRLDAVLPPHATHFPAADDDPLVDAALRLANAPLPVMPPEMLARIQARVVATAEQPPVQHRISRLQTTPLLRLAALFVLIFLAFEATQVGGSTPGKIGYGLKRGVESIEILLAAEPETRANVYLTHAERRTDEAAALLASGHFDQDLLIEARNDLETSTEIAASAPGVSAQAASITARISGIAQAAVAAKLVPPEVVVSLLPTPTETPAPTSTEKPTVVPTATLTSTVQPSATHPPTATNTQKPTVVPTTTPTPTVQPSATNPPTATSTQKPTDEPTATLTPTVQPSATHPLTHTPTATPINTVQPSATATPQPTKTLTMLPSPTLAATVIPSATLAPTLVVTPSWGYIIAQRNVKIRKGPGTQFEVLKVIQPGIQVEIIGGNADHTWVQIRLPDELTGWMSADLITTGPTPVYVNNNDSNGNGQLSSSDATAAAECAHSGSYCTAPGQLKNNLPGDNGATPGPNDNKDNPGNGGQPPGQDNKPPDTGPPSDNKPPKDDKGKK
ncbi:MAG TPA: DUF5667 domain-containing protein [Phototrophicaceae bacterium]|nr:DUF5667 domain-containing protein [Phototrophicaceae bacterium]